MRYVLSADVSFIDIFRWNEKQLEASDRMPKFRSNSKTSIVCTFILSLDISNDLSTSISKSSIFITLKPFSQNDLIDWFLSFQLLIDVRGNKFSWIVQFICICCKTFSYYLLSSIGCYLIWKKDARIHPVTTKYRPRVFWIQTSATVWWPGMSRYNRQHEEKPFHLYRKYERKLYHWNFCFLVN